MGMKAKLIASIEVKCEGHSIYDILLTNTHYIPDISPSKINHFEIHEGEIMKVGSVVSWKYNHDGEEKIVKEMIEAIDHQKKSITWKAIEGNLLDSYNSFTTITSIEHNWITLTLVYEKKTEDTPEPLDLLGFFIDSIKDIEAHLLNI